jgi:hypothetical protein
MPRQHEFFQAQLIVRPRPDAAGPRLWVRRLVIWREAGGEVIRDVALRPGLNIVWTPGEERIGHGGGKTLFCRLLRYCLGEERFAPEEQRERIAMVLPDGLVGAEVMLDGACWAIVRPLGVRRRHMAVRDGDLEQLARGDNSATGIEPFLDAVEESLITSGVAALVPKHRQEHRGWPVALAWLARDQECRFDHVLDWRSTASDSESPARALNQTEKLDALRAFLRGITPEEQAKRKEIAGLDAKRNALEQEIAHRRWEARRLWNRLTSALGVAGDMPAETPIAIAQLREAAQARFAKATGLATAEDASEVEAAQQDHEAAREEVAAFKLRLGVAERDIPNSKRIIAQINGEYPGLSFALEAASSFPCPICEVPVDRVLAEGCKLSYKVPDLQACRARLERNRIELAEENRRLQVAEKEKVQVQRELAVALQRETRQQQRVKKLQDARNSREAAWYSAKRLIEEVAQLAKLTDEHIGAETKLGELVKAIEEEKGRLDAFLDQQARVVADISLKFDPIIKHLIGSEAAGTLTLTRNSLELRVQMGGNRSTPAIDSLKIVAFDIAALCRSIEGDTHVPAFLIHDSSREADLGLTIYHNVFELARWLESIGKTPLFQYVVTTTTQPPTELTKQPWLVLTLEGAPAEKRLLKCDL